MPSIRILDCSLASYKYGESQFVVAANAQDVWQLQGPAGTVAKIRFVGIGGTTPTVRTQQVLLFKRSTPTTGASGSIRTAIPVDSKDAAPASILTRWPTVTVPGNSIGQVDSTTMTLNTGTTAIPQDHAVFDYRQVVQKAIVLNGANEYLCVNFNGSGTTVNDKIDFDLRWTEGT